MYPTYARHWWEGLSGPGSSVTQLYQRAVPSEWVPPTLSQTSFIDHTKCDVKPGMHQWESHLTTRQCGKSKERAPWGSALIHLFSVAGRVCVSLGCFFCRKVTFPDQRISSYPRSWYPMGSVLCLFSSSSSLKQPFPFLLFFSSFNVLNLSVLQLPLS